MGKNSPTDIINAIYKLAALSRGDQNVLFLDTSKLNVPDTNGYLTPALRKTLSAQVSQQFEEQFPGITKQFDSFELASFAVNSAGKGPSAIRVGSDKSICLITLPRLSDLEAGGPLGSPGIQREFNPHHFKPFLFTPEELARIIAEHEREHCEQTTLKKSDENLEVKILDGETRSDRVAMARLRKEGKDDIADAWKHMRALLAAGHDHKHATSIFLDDQDFDGATIEHYNAAASFGFEMNLAVSELSHISLEEADNLRRSDPQRYADIVEDALQTNQIPVRRRVFENDVMTLIANELDIAISAISKQKASDLSAAYQKLKENGQTHDHGGSTPQALTHIKTYMEQYIAATRFLFVPDTSPPPADLSPEQLQDMALRHSAETVAYDVMNNMVKDELGLSLSDADNLRITNSRKFHDTVETVLKRTTGPLQAEIPIPSAQLNDMIASRLGIPATELYDQPRRLVDIAKKEIFKENGFTIKQENPYLRLVLEARIQGDRQYSAPQNAPTTPQIDLKGDDGAKMKISGMSGSEYFATKADPVLAAAALKPVPATPIKDATLSSKVAPNNPDYLAMA